MNTKRESETIVKEMWSKFERNLQKMSYVYERHLRVVWVKCKKAFGKSGKYYVWKKIVVKLEEREKLES